MVDPAAGGVEAIIELALGALVIELVGYAASLIVLVSLLMSDMGHLRTLNLVGALTFTVYGLLVGALPVAVVNLLIAVIDAYYLVRMRRERHRESANLETRGPPTLIEHPH